MMSRAEWSLRRQDNGVEESKEHHISGDRLGRSRWSAAYDVRDRKFLTLVLPDAPLERLATGFKWAEGPVYFAEWDALLFSDIPENSIWCWRRGLLSPFRSPSNFANGNTRDGQGRLVTCEHGARRVTRTEPNGCITVLADATDGARLNSPNDVIVNKAGDVWFTDPTYGIASDYEGHKAEPEYGSRGVFVIKGGRGEPEMVLGDFIQPNGLAFSPEETTLYVADSGATHEHDGPHHIRAVRFNARGRLASSEIFCEIDVGVPDGIRVDLGGNVWSSAADGVHVFDKGSNLLGKIFFPEVVSNLCFGGPRANLLYVTSSTSIFRLPLATSMV